MIRTWRWFFHLRWPPQTPFRPRKDNLRTFSAKRNKRHFGENWVMYEFLWYFQRGMQCTTLFCNKSLSYALKTRLKTTFLAERNKSASKSLQIATRPLFRRQSNSSQTKKQVKIVWSRKPFSSRDSWMWALVIHVSARLIELKFTVVRSLEKIERNIDNVRIAREADY